MASKERVFNQESSLSLSLWLSLRWKRAALFAESDIIITDFYGLLWPAESVALTQSNLIIMVII